MGSPLSMLHRLIRGQQNSGAQGARTELQLQKSGLQAGGPRRAVSVASEPLPRHQTWLRAPHSVETGVSVKARDTEAAHRWGTAFTSGNSTRSRRLQGEPCFPPKTRGPCRESPRGAEVASPPRSDPFAMFPEPSQAWSGTSSSAIRQALSTLRVVSIFQLQKLRPRERKQRVQVCSE